jgi:hypothetical protein
MQAASVLFSSVQALYAIGHRQKLLLFCSGIVRLWKEKLLLSCSVQAFCTNANANFFCSIPFCSGVLSKWKWKLLLVCSEVISQWT